MRVGNSSKEKLYALRLIPGHVMSVCELLIFRGLTLRMRNICLCVGLKDASYVKPTKCSVLSQRWPPSLQ